MSKPLFAGADPAHPLRPYATKPDDSLAFAPIPAPPSRVGTSSSSSTTHPTRISLRPPSSGDSAVRTSSFADLEGDDEGRNILQAFLSSTLMGFTSTAMVMPFEVAKTLLQVQWVPKDEGYVELHDEGATPSGAQSRTDLDAYRRDDDEDDDTSSYFPDSSLPHSTSFSRSQQAPAIHHSRAQSHHHQQAATVQKRSVYDDGAKPSHLLPMLGHGGVWEMMKLIARSKQEGYSSLWKGTLTTYCLDTIGTYVQPVFFGALSYLLPPSHLPTISLVHSPHPTPLLILTVISHAFTGFLLSPLDLLRTRLIVQSRSASSSNTQTSTSRRPSRRRSHHPHRNSYSAFPGALSHIAATEGGWLRAFYTHPTVLFPALLDVTLRPLVHYTVPLVIERAWHISPDEAPVLFGLAELVLNTLGLFVTLPVETVRRRLQVQSRREDADPRTDGREDGAVMGEGVRTTVEIRPKAYVGVVDATWSILTEEATGPAAGKRVDRSKGVTLDGLRQLYRGFGMGLVANGIVFVLGVAVGRDRQQSPGWAEI